MKFSDIIYSILSSDSDVNTYTGGRIYPDVIERHAALPAISFTLNGFTRQNTKGNEQGHDILNVAFTLLAHERNHCELLAGYVDTAMTRVAASNASDEIVSANIENMSWDFYPDDEVPRGEQRGQVKYIQELTYTIWRKQV